MTKQQVEVEQFRKEITILREYRWCRNNGFGHSGAVHDIATADRPKSLDMTEQEIDAFVLKVVYDIDIDRCRKDKDYFKQCLEMCV